MKLGESLSSGPAKRIFDELTASLRTQLGDIAEDAAGRGDGDRACGDADGLGDDGWALGEAGGHWDDCWALGDAGGRDAGRAGLVVAVGSCPATRSLRTPAFTSASISFR